MNSPSSSAFNIPEISLDFENEISDVDKLKELPHLLSPPSCDVSDLILQLREQPTDCSLHAQLSAYLFARYTATVEYAKKVQTEPCYECLETSDALRKLQEASKAFPQLERDIELILTRSFVRPSEYPEIQQKQSADEFGEQIAELRRECSGFLDDTANSTIPSAGNFEDELRALKRDEIQAFNRAVELLGEKDQENFALAEELKETSTKQQEYLELIGQFQTGEKRLKQQIQAYEQSLESAVQPESTAFAHFVTNQIHSVPVPQIEKDFKNDKFAQPRTVSRPLVDILREAAYLLSKTLGSNDVRVEQAQFRPKATGANLTESEIEVLGEMNSIVSLCVLLRFEIEACLSASEPQQAALPQEQEHNAEIELEVAQETLNNIKAGTQQIIEHAFSMAFPPKMEQRSVGSYTSDELQQVISSAMPEGFYDTQLLEDLNQLYMDISSEPTLNDITSDIQVLQNILKGSSRRSKIVESQVITVGESAFELEKEVKERELLIDQLHQQLQELKTLHNDQVSLISQLETQLKTKEGEITALEAQINAQKNNNLELKIENERIPGLEGYCKEAKKDTEAEKFKIAQEEQLLENAQLEKDQLLQDNSKRKGEIDHLSQELSSTKDRVRQLELDEKDLEKLKQDTVSKNRELLALARDLEEQLGQSEKEVIQLKQTVSREMPTLEQNSQTYRTLMENAENELVYVKEELRKVKEAEKDLKLAFEQADSRYNQIKEQESDLETTADRATAELKTVQEEAEHFAELLAREQEKSSLLGENLDEVSALNIELEKQRTALTAEIEVLKHELAEEGGILGEVNESYQRSREAAEKFEHLYVEETERVQEKAQHTSAFEAKNSILIQEQQRTLDINEQLRAEIKSKQMLIEQMQAEMSGMTMNSMGNENELKAMLKGNFEKEIQEIMQSERTQHQEELEAVETDRNELLSEFEQLRIENAQINKESKRLEKENAIYKEELQQIQEIQTKLANKSKKLLKTTNLLKQKSLQFARSFERISTYCGDVARYNATIQPPDTQNAMSLTSLTQTVSPDEVHASDAVRIPMVTEDFLKAVCDLVTAGRTNHGLQDALSAAKSETTKVQQIVGEEQEKTRTASEEAERWHTKYEELKQQNEVMSSTIAMLSTREAPMVPRQPAESARHSADNNGMQTKQTSEQRVNIPTLSVESERSSVIGSPLDTAEALVRRLEDAENSNISEEHGGENETVERIVKEERLEKQQEKGADTQSARAVNSARSPSEPVRQVNERWSDSRSAEVSLVGEQDVSDSAEQQILNMLHQYHPENRRVETSETDESVQNLTPTERPMIRPVSVSLAGDIGRTPEIASEFEESVRSFQGRRGMPENTRDVSLLSDDERLMIERLLQQ